MTDESAKQLSLRGILCFFLLFSGLIASSFSQEKVSTKFLNPQNIVGAKKCGECHEYELQTLQSSRHHSSFSELHSRDKALAIVKLLGGEPRIDKRKDCAKCHYTQKSDADTKRMQTIGGVSCESCHGAAKRWWNVHWKGEGKKLAKNMKKSEQRGMLRPHNLLGLVDRCLDCHLVTDETLVSKGQHPSGTDFELLSWVQGEVRHNFMKSEEFGVNLPVTSERQRCFYVLGRLHQMGRSLGAFAVLKDRNGALGQQLGRGILLCYQELKKLRSFVKALSQLPTILGEIRLKESSPDDLLEAAQKIAKLSETLLASKALNSSANIDRFLPKSVRGKVSEFQESE
jgi:hypothetical protein